MHGWQCGAKLQPPTVRARIDASRRIAPSTAQDVPMTSVIQFKPVSPFPDIERISEIDDNLLHRYMKYERTWKFIPGEIQTLHMNWPFDLDRNTLVVSSKAIRISAMISSLFFERYDTEIKTIYPKYFHACYTTLQKMSSRDLDERSFIALYILTRTLTLFQWDLTEILSCFKALCSLLTHSNGLSLHPG